jgi:transposase
MYVPPREYSREFKIGLMREIDAGRRIVEVARQYQVSPHMVEKWRALWRARGEAAFPGRGRRGPGEPASEEQRIAELERKIGQLTMENDFLKKSLNHLSQRKLPGAVSGDAASSKTTKQPSGEEMPPQ